MGNWHCIPSSCATVAYREYLPPMVRWRYPGEDWQAIEADDYALDQEVGKGDVKYHAFGTLININIQQAECRSLLYWRTGLAAIGTNIQSWMPVIGNQNKVGPLAKNGAIISLYPVTKSEYDSKILSDRSGIYFLNDNGRCIAAGSQPLGYDFKLTDVLRQDKLPDTSNCIFKLYKQGLQIRTETRAVCPEVEKLPCRLSDVRQEVKIEKFAYLERAEVVPYFYQNYLGFLPVIPTETAGATVYQDAIPKECLCIYKNTLETIIPQFSGYPTPANTVQSVYGYITQICSSPGCPPPEYQVLCDCNDCESCPPNTCAVDCDGNICCYDNTGKSVKEIAAVNYCGGTA